MILKYNKIIVVYFLVCRIVDNKYMLQQFILEMNRKQSDNYSVVEICPIWTPIWLLYN